ncbi:MAG: leucine-rich repeat domain-containing protein [Promethearchaeota archaeon]
MGLTVEQIIQAIVQQANLPRRKVLERVRDLQRSLRYEPETSASLDDDPSLPKLLAQELNVDLGDPTDYLYAELIFDQWPLFVRIIPLSTIDKEKISIALTKLILQLEDQLKASSPRMKRLLLTEPPVAFSKRIFNVLEHWIGPKQGAFFVKDGILVNFKFYSDDHPGSFSLDEIVQQAELFRTFSDYQVIRSSDSSKVYLPFSLVDKTFYHPPKWAFVDDENREGWLQFSHISLASLVLSPDLEAFSLDYTRTKEIIDSEALQHCPRLKVFRIYDETLRKFNFPKDLSLLDLESLYINGPTLSFLDLSFLTNSPNLSLLEISHSFIGRLILPPFDKHALLAKIKLNAWLESLDLISPWHCPRLQKVDLSDNHLRHLDLSPLSSCPNLQLLNLSSNELSHLDLAALCYCSELQELNLRRNNLTTIDLSPIQSCINLQKLDLSHNRLEELDLSPLAKHPSLREIYLGNNPLKTIDQSPLDFCPNLEIRNLESDPSLPSKPYRPSYWDSPSVPMIEQEEDIIPQEQGVLATLGLEQSSFRVISKDGHITKLDLTDLSLDILPPTVSSLAYLNSLIVKNNRLHTLPEEIGDISKDKPWEMSIYHMDFSDNDLSTLPATLGNLSSLDRLLVRGNNIETLPEEIGNLQSLFELDLADNKLKYLPKSLGKLSYLNNLNLRSNQLLTLPKELGQLHKLQFLDASYNNLTGLPSTLRGLCNLQELSLENNRIKEIPDEIWILHKLRKLNLAFNDLTSLASSLGRLVNLQILDIRNNPIKMIPVPLLNRLAIRVLKTDISLPVSNLCRFEKRDEVPRFMELFYNHISQHYIKKPVIINFSFFPASSLTSFTYINIFHFSQRICDFLLSMLRNSSNTDILEIEIGLSSSDLRLIIYDSKIKDIYPIQVKSLERDLIPNWITDICLFELNALLKKCEGSFEFHSVFNCGIVLVVSIPLSCFLLHPLDELLL